MALGAFGPGYNMPIKDLVLSNSYDRQRFLQFSPSDVANWYAVEAPTGKKKGALYPTMGRKHLVDLEGNLFIYPSQPRKIFKSIDYVYVVVGSTIYQIDDNFNQVQISTNIFTSNTPELNFAFLPVIQSPGSTPLNQKQAVFCMFCDGENIFVYDESLQSTPAFTKVDDANRPKFPLYVAAFGNRFVVSTANSTQFQLTQINMGGAYDPNTVFTIPGQNVVFAQESGLIRQFAVLHQQLYIFTDYTTGIWSNTPSVFLAATFPWKKNTSYDFDYGIADPQSVDVDFGMIVWLAQNRNGLVQFMMTNGQSPIPISTQAINVLIQRVADAVATQRLLDLDTIGFLYQYEDTMFYRVTIGDFANYQTLDKNSVSQALEYNFNTKTWHRCIELNGERNIIEEHEFFNNRHIVTCQGQTCLYDMAGDYYTNELQIPTDLTTFEEFPFRYENVTPIICEDDYSEFITDYVQIDFVWGQQDFSFSIYSTDSTLNDSTFNVLLKPSMELYFSDDGGVSFNATDNLEFSQLGIYSWRMRWYQCGVSRNRVYKLICVSPAPVVILGAVQNVRRVSGGAN